MRPLAAREPVSPSTTSYGQVIEYIQGRLYLASYTHPPNQSTPFPYSAPAANSPTKRSSQVKTETGPQTSPVYFTIDDDLLYNRFHADFGPLHVGHLYRFSVYLHNVLGNPAYQDRSVVFWSRPDSRSRANAACILACYMVLIQAWPPHLALAPIAQADPPLMPFRDAGYSQADFGLSVQDVVYGVWKAKEENLCGFREFSLEEYERYERVDQGDFNWITPQFLALASPQHQPVAPIAQDSPAYASVPKTRSEVKASKTLPGPFKNVLSHFSRRNVGVIVRLNSELYSPTYFTALGINHIDMIFDDGTCPSLPMVKQFIKLAHDMITIKKKAIAVHCKAGLGRTGCLIGAYLIYRHGFTANEVIAFMRFMRPGMVVGPQQHWLHLNQGTFREWWWEDIIKEKLAAVLPSTPNKSSRTRQDVSNHTQYATPQTGGQQNRRHALGEISHNESMPTPKIMDENLPAPTPGQPRKTHRLDARHHPYARAASGSMIHDTASGAPSEQITEMKRHRQSNDPSTPRVEEENWISRTVSSSQQSPDHSSVSGKMRQTSYTTSSTTTMTTATAKYAPTAEEQLELEMTSDVENWISHPQDTASSDHIKPAVTKPVMTTYRSNGTLKSGNGSGTIGVAKARGSPVRRSADSNGRAVTVNGVRKTSGRVASVGTVGRVRS